MIKTDDFLDSMNLVKEAQKRIFPYLNLHQDFIYANVQLQIAIRLIEDGLSDIDNRDNGAVPLVFIPETRR